MGNGILQNGKNTLGSNHLENKIPSFCYAVDAETPNVQEASNTPLNRLRFLGIRMPVFTSPSQAPGTDRRELQDFEAKPRRTTLSGTPKVPILSSFKQVFGIPLLCWVRWVTSFPCHKTKEARPYGRTPHRPRRRPLYSCFRRPRRSLSLLELPSVVSWGSRGGRPPARSVGRQGREATEVDQEVWKW